jgi:para-nitrobenzyl esterase
VISSPAFRARRATALALLCLPVVTNAQRPEPRVDGVPVVGAGRTANNIDRFLGIPYAEPPVGSRRWAPPVPYVPRAASIAASAFGPACPQGMGIDDFVRGLARVFGREAQVPRWPTTTSEDCLTLNVWAPAHETSAAPRPVMVWIHGGSNVTGGTSQTIYDGEQLARKGVVVVSLNYRLGVLGFFAHPAITAASPIKTSGNYALLDQIEGLRWVQRNIAAFGGDPSQITVFGESAGAMNILHLLASPLAQGLFHRAILQSGAPVAKLATRGEAESAGMRIAETVGATGPDALAKLRTTPTDQLLAAWDKVTPGGGNALADAIIDDWVVTDATGRRFTNGEYARIPLLIGSNADEITSLQSLLPRYERTTRGYRSLTDSLFGKVGGFVIRRQYRAPNDAAVQAAVTALATDVVFTCPSRFVARVRSTSEQPTYRYLFTRVVPGGEALRAYHSADLGYMFGNVEPWLPPLPQTDHALSETMMKYWINFAMRGDPNGPGLPEWPTAGANGDRYLQLGDPIATGTGRSKRFCDLYDKALPKQWPAVQ